MRATVIALAFGIALSGAAFAQQESGPGTASDKHPPQGNSASSTAKPAPATGTPAAPSSGQPAEVVKTKTKSNQSND